jgi:hypothetical protein
LVVEKLAFWMANVAENGYTDDFYVNLLAIS